MLEPGNETLRFFRRVDNQVGSNRWLNFKNSVDDVLDEHRPHNQARALEVRLKNGFVILDEMTNVLDVLLV